jgi:predicted RNase H-like HicB family nuclease
MKEIDYIVWQEDSQFVSQCLNVDVASCGDTVDEAIANLKEAMELYLEGENIEIPVVGKFIFGKELINV